MFREYDWFQASCGAKFQALFVFKRLYEFLGIERHRESCCPEKMEGTGTSSGVCEANESKAQEECPAPSAGNEALDSVPHSEQRSGLTGGSLDTQELGEEVHTSGRSEDCQVGQASEVTMHLTSSSALIDALAGLFGHVPSLHLLLSLGHDAMEGERVIDWNKCTEFREWCAQRWESKALCGIILKEKNSATYNVGVVHSEESIALSWHKLRLDRREPVNTLCSGDGGLVCFGLTFPGEGDDLRLALTVVNPLTAACRVLPSDHGVSPFDLKMMQLVVDKSTRQYQVLLVHNEYFFGSNSLSENPHAPVWTDWKEHLIDPRREVFPPWEGVIFDSGTGAWRSARSSSQVFLGPAIHEERYVRDLERGWIGSKRDRGVGDASYHRMDFQGSSEFFGPVAYDCASARVLFLRDDWDVMSCLRPEFALSKDRLFENVTLRLFESQVQVGKDHLDLELVKQHKLYHLSRESGEKITGDSYVSVLQHVACEGFVLVRGAYYINYMDRPIDVAQLYDMRAGEWVDLLEGRQDPAAPHDKPKESGDEDEDSDKAEEESTRSRAKKCRRQVVAYRDYPCYFESAPFMLSNLDWEADP